MSNKLKILYGIGIGIILFIIISIITVIKVVNSNIEYVDTQVEENNNKYENKSEYKRKYRHVEYIGGENIYLDHPYGLSFDEVAYVGERWYPFYRDVDTGEILRGRERYTNYITAGVPFIGIDKMDVPKERKTRKGFKDYVLEWTGSVFYRDFDYTNDMSEKRRIFGKTKGLGLYEITSQYFYQYYDMPIDLISNYLLGLDEEIMDNKDIEKIDNIEEVKKYKFLDFEGPFSENEWVLNILRNCFGFISDDFFEINFNNKINFREIRLKEVQIGDIGVYGDEEYGYKCGICIGYDKKYNPIFSICTSNEKVVDKNIDSEYITEKVKRRRLYKGYNALYVEKENNTIFNKYYKTNLPFEDGNKYNKKDFIIKDIKIYNKLIPYEELEKRVINERVRRISEREKKAEEIRKRENIDLKQLKNIDITTLFLINEMESYEYRLYAYGIDEEDREAKKEELKRKTYDETIIESINEMSDDYLSYDEDDIKELFNDEYNIKGIEKAINDYKQNSENNQIEFYTFMKQKYGIGFTEKIMKSYIDKFNIKIK